LCFPQWFGERFFYITNVRKKSIYLETTIPSYATAKPSTDIIVAARQLLTNLSEFGYTRIFHNLKISRRINMPAYQDPILAEVRRIRTEIAKD